MCYNEGMRYGVTKQRALWLLGFFGLAIIIFEPYILNTMALFIFLGIVPGTSNALQPDVMFASLTLLAITVAVLAMRPVVWLIIRRISSALGKSRVVGKPVKSTGKIEASL